ncbi:MAG: glycoside hydrolase family 13 protein [Cyanobacteria bacterium J06641_5]
MEISTPGWVKHAVFYQIFPDRFARSQQASSSLGLTWEPWETSPTLHGYKGGDLWGARDRLDYLANLGITAIYFTPIFQSASNHRYHTHDYYRVDPLLGGNTAFQEFLAAAHARDIKVILDGVFNHASRGFFGFNDILENGKSSPWLDWFKIQGWPLAPYSPRKAPNYDCWWNNRALPQFNHANPAVREYLMGVAEYWVRQGIDGWRLDVPEEIRAPGFWQEFRARIKAINPEAYIVGEVWGNASTWLDGSQFDAVMNYLFAGPTIAFVAGDRVVRKYAERQDYEPYPALDAVGYAAKIEALLGLYAPAIQQAQLNLLASHDTARLLTLAGGDRASVELATLLLLTFPGAPCIYYGDEVGLPGGNDPDCRRGFPPEEQWDRELLAAHQQLIALRHRYPALRTGAYKVVRAEGSIYAFARLGASAGDASVLVVVNTGTEAQTIALDTSVFAAVPTQIVYGTPQVQTSEGIVSLTVLARSGCAIAGDS